ncbi:HET-domain-containing protein, partial [Coniochaeta ligniaria NRRL 30616]
PVSARSFCAKIPFDPVALNAISSSTGQHAVFDLGSYKRLRKSTCPFCGLVAQMYYETGKIDIRVLKVADTKNVTIQWGLQHQSGLQSFTLQASQEKGFQICFVSPLPRPFPSVALGSANGMDVDIDIAASARSLHPAFCLRAWRPSEFDPDQVLSWLGACIHGHGDECNAHTADTFETAFPGLGVMRFVDVRQMCIVERRGLCKYAALSYVWGVAPILHLTTNNRDTLMTPGFLLTTSAWVPSTLEDAIEVTQRLVLDYLWIDALCLMQNDPADLERGIHVMDMIYERSHVTLVAAAGHDSWYGLPGVRQGSRRIVDRKVEVGPATYVDLHSTDDMRVVNTPYDSRAWTLQEYILPRRVLIFCHDEIYFRCRQASYSEALRADPPRHCDCDGPSTSTNTILFDAARLRNPLVDYDRILSVFSQRHLTKDSDALRAMSGFIRRVADLLDCDFFEGLPVPAFDVFLTFRSEGYSLARRQGGLPSYSWVGWKGEHYTMVQGHYKTVDLLDWMRKATWIRWYQRVQHGSTVILKPIWEDRPGRPRSEFSSPRDDHPPFNRKWLDVVGNTSQYETTLSNGVNVSRFRYPVLQFWTLIVFVGLRITNVIFGQAKLLDKEGLICGKILLDSFDQFSATNDLFELLILSYAHPKDDEFGPFMVKLDENSYLRRLGLDSTEWEREEYRFYYVMLIERDGGGVAERRGFGVMSRLAVSASCPPGPVWKEVLLA